MEAFQKLEDNFFMSMDEHRKVASQSTVAFFEHDKKAPKSLHPVESKGKIAKRLKLKSLWLIDEGTESKEKKYAKHTELKEAEEEKLAVTSVVDTYFIERTPKNEIVEKEKLKKAGKKRKYEEIEKPVEKEEKVEYLEQNYSFLGLDQLQLQPFSPPLQYADEEDKHENQKEFMHSSKKKKSGIHGLKEFRKTCKDWKNSPNGRIWTTSFRLLFTSNSKWTLGEEGKIWLKALKGKNEISSKSWEFLMARGFEHLQVIIGEATGSMEINAALIYANMRCLRAVELQCNQTSCPFEPTLSSMSEFSSRKNRKKPNASHQYKISLGTLANPIGSQKEEHKLMIGDLKSLCVNAGIFSEFDVPSTIDILKAIENILCKIDEIKLRKAAFGVGKWWYNTPEDCEDVFTALLNISKILALHQVLIDKAPKNGIRCGPISAMIYKPGDEEMPLNSEEEFIKINAVKLESQKLLHITYYGNNEEPKIFQADAYIAQIAENVLKELCLEEKYSNAVFAYIKADQMFSKCVYSYCDKTTEDETFGMESETEDESLSVHAPKQKLIPIEKAKELKDNAEVSLEGARKKLAQNVAKQLFENSKELLYWFNDTISPLSKTFRDNKLEKRQFCLEIKKSLTELGGQFSSKDEEIYRTI
jgi:hypothetical protein